MSASPQINRLASSQFRPKITVTKSSGTQNTQVSKGQIGLPQAKKAFQMPNQQVEEALAKIQYEIRTHHKHGNYEEALKASKQLLNESQEHFGKDHPATASAYNNVGLMHKLMGNWADSRKSYHESLRIYGRVVGKDHASYAAALHNVGLLNKTQVHVDEQLTGLQRLQLNEEALEYLHEAWQIRQVELGDEHAHTISSRSNYGSTLAAQVLQVNQHGQSKTTKAPMSKMTRRRWEAAEDHLRQALLTAMEHPRGEQIAPTSSNSSIKTLSAAASAQNLAVFLKTRGTRVEDSDKTEIIDPEALAEAQQLYQQALVVRSQLLPATHADVIATKFSLAELLTVLGNEKEANVLREEIMEVYNVQEMNEESTSVQDAEVEGNGGPGNDSRK
jgi:tetratricopeptide (TPR) repeat protein